jgi:hypothetical protein
MASCSGAQTPAAMVRLSDGKPKQGRKVWMLLATRVEVQEHGHIEVAILAAFFILSVQVLVPSQGQELVPIAEMDKNIFPLPI